MNIAKKLLFSLLLCGSVFAAACGDDGPAKEGDSCSATLKCEDGLGCVATNEGDETGTCKKTCTSTSCSATQECKETPKVKDAESAPSICQDKASGGQEDDTKVKVGDPCTQTNKCIETAVCVLAKATDSEGTCQLKCGAESPKASDCIENGKPACVQTDGFTNGNVGKVLTCAAANEYYGGNAVPEGKKCNATATCKSGLVCIEGTETGLGTCVTTCTGAAACTTTEKPACAEKGNVLGTYTDKKVCVEPLEYGIACTETKECKQGHACANGHCEKKCANTPECSPAQDGKDTCKNQPETGGTGDVMVCSAP